MPDDTPNPGSDAAIKAGCICPILDNNHGRTPPRAVGQWWVTEGCKLHDKTNHTKN